MKYEGDVPSGWGSLNAKQMTSFFWMAGLSGVYGMHGDTYKNNSDTETEVRWWAKGGTLMGESPKRITFFKGIMEEAPLIEMTPELVSLSGLTVPEYIADQGHDELIDDLNNNIYIFSKENEYYLAYTTDSAQIIEINLEGEKEYSFEVIDTWNMKIVSKGNVSSGKFQYKTEFPYTAIRLISQ